MSPTCSREAVQEEQRKQDLYYCERPKHKVSGHAGAISFSMRYQHISENTSESLDRERCPLVPPLVQTERLGELFNPAFLFWKIRESTHHLLSVGFSGRAKIQRVPLSTTPQTCAYLYAVGRRVRWQATEPSVPSYQRGKPSGRSGKTTKCK